MSVCLYVCMSVCLYVCMSVCIPCNHVLDLSQTSELLQTNVKYIAPRTRKIFRNYTWLTNTIFGVRVLTISNLFNNNSFNFSIPFFFTYSSRVTHIGGSHVSFGCAAAMISYIFSVLYFFPIFSLNVPLSVLSILYLLYFAL